MANVALLNKDGSIGEYPIGRGVRLFTKNGTIQDFFPGIAENLTVNLDFSEGSMFIEPPENGVFENVNIIKPANLIPENVAEGVDIAGVIGILKGGGESMSELFPRYLAYQIDDENKEVTIYGILWSQLYSDTGSYDIEIPSHYGDYRVIISSEGVV